MLPTASATTAKEASLFQLVNEARAKRGIGPVGLSDQISRMARHHSRQMASQRLLFHSACLSCRFPIVWNVLGENVGVAFSVRRVHRMMMKSSSHRGNILGTAFTSVGMGVVKKGRRFWITEIFFG
jgi:uncharacterized protein YkwD